MNKTPDWHDIVRVAWFNPRTKITESFCIGIVTIRDKNTNEEKSYIGIGEGYSEKEDILYILQHWAKFIYIY